MPRLRSDKVALRLVQGVRGALEGASPGALLDIAQSLLECVEAPGVAGSDLAARNLRTLRRVCEQVLDADACAKVVAAIGRECARAIRD